MGGGPAKQTLLAILPFPEPKPIIASLRAKFPTYEIHYLHHAPSSTPPHIPADLWRSATVLITLFAFPEPHQVPHLELIHLVSAGSDQIQGTKIWSETEIAITTSSGIHGPQIAEWVVMTGLVWSHGYRELWELQKRRRWGKGKEKEEEGKKAGYEQVRDMVGRRIGILGYGSIGRQVGRVAKAMGMHVVAFTATEKDTAEKKRDRGFIVPGTGDEAGEIPIEWYSGLDKTSLRNFLQRDLDWLVISVPLTKDTRHFLSAEEFRALSHAGEKPAFVTNIARGPIVDQPALVAALKDGTLAGAALDVTDPEPLPEESELWGLENVIVTPHVSGSGVAYTERTFGVLEINLGRRERGEGLLNVVRRGRGY